MARAITEIEAKVRGLRPSGSDADRLWLEEAQRRSHAFDAGLVEPVPAEDVFNRVRARLDQ